MDHAVFSSNDVSTDFLDGIEEPTVEDLYASEQERRRDQSPRSLPYSFEGEPVRKALAVLISDHQADHANGTDRLVTELLREGGYHVDGVVHVAGESHDIRQVLETAVVGGVDLVITVGGTGMSPRDTTAEVTSAVIDMPLEGISQALRASGLACGAVDACVSRGVAGVSASTVIVNIASSRCAIRDGMATLLPLVRYVIDDIQRVEEVE